jgi:steroid delta-isomerase-like uncharacterized protein
MSTETNTSLVRHFIDNFNRKDPQTAIQVFHTDYVLDFPGGPTARGPEGLKQAMNDFSTAFPNLHFETDELFAEEDRVVWRWTMHATNAGPLGPFPASRQPVTLTAISLFRVADGKIIEDKVRADMIGLFQQMGVIPGPVAAENEGGL